MVYKSARLRANFHHEKVSFHFKYIAFLDDFFDFHDIRAAVTPDAPRLSTPQHPDGKMRFIEDFTAGRCRSGVSAQQIAPHAFSFDTFIDHTVTQAAVGRCFMRALAALPRCHFTDMLMFAAFDEAALRLAARSRGLQWQTYAAHGHQKCGCRRIGRKRLMLMIRAVYLLNHFATHAMNFGLLFHGFQAHARAAEFLTDFFPAAFSRSPCCAMITTAHSLGDISCRRVDGRSYKSDVWWWWWVRFRCMMILALLMRSTPTPPRRRYFGTGDWCCRMETCKWRRLRIIFPFTQIRLPDAAVEQRISLRYRRSAQAWSHLPKAAVADLIRGASTCCYPAFDLHLGWCLGMDLPIFTTTRICRT